jgi:hypothetical protein
MLELSVDTLAEELAQELGIEVPVAPPIWTPQPGPQTLANNSRADEVGFGGQAGGGKTDLAIGLSLTQFTRSIIFRRISKNLRAIIDRTINIVGSSEGLNQSTNVWRLPSGRQLEFGYMQHENSKFDWRGNPHELYVFDEGSEFNESQIDFVTAWKRTTIPGQRTQTLITFNPPTDAQGEWLIERFGPWINPQHPNPAAPGELRWYAMVDGKRIEVQSGTSFMHNGELIEPTSRTFIPARLEDNIYLTNTEYRAQLQSLPEPLRSQLLYGRFDLILEDDPWQVIPTKWVQAAQRRWLETEKPDLQARSVGADVARGGIDKSSVARLFGNWFDLHSRPGAETPDGPTAAEWIGGLAGGAPISLDVIGIGSSVYDSHVTRGDNVAGVNFGASTKATDQTGKFGFLNIRAEAYWRLREALDPASGENLCLPQDRALLADLCAPRFKVVSGKIQIEDKESIKSRINRSPDDGDAVTLCWYGASREFKIIEVDT